MIVGLGAPVVFGLVGVAVDYSTFANQRDKLQKAADAAALASAQELRIGTPTEARIQAVAENVVTSQAPPAKSDNAVVVKAEGTRPTGARASSADAKVAAIREPASPYDGVKVTLTQRKTAIMSRLVTPHLTDLQVTATARMAGGTRICVIGLHETAPDTIRLVDQAKISAPGCSVYANSASTTAIRSESNAVVTSMQTCSAGGYKASTSANFQPRVPVTDCPKQADPLADRPAPPVGLCLVPSLLKLVGVTRTLNPGTYCGGLVIDKGARVTLNPGVYVIKDGPLIVGPAKSGDDDDDDDDGDDDDSTSASTGYLRGTGVGFYFTGTVKPEKQSGKTVAMRFEKNSVVEITAPTSGPMAGLLLHENRTSVADRRFEVLSDSARKLVGTIYVPRGIFSVDATQSVADQSEYTAVVTRRLELSKAPNLVLNTRYGDTNVPVPDGLGPNSGKLRLVE